MASTPKPPKSQILRAYRSLLRSTSYLPDSLSRIRIHNEIVTRFRKRARRPADPETLRTLISYQRTLDRACDLHAKELESVLYLTYGRKGTRRRVLVDSLRCEQTKGVGEEEADLPDDLSLQGFIDVLEGRGKGEVKGGRKERASEGEKFQALLKSQKENLASFEKCKVKDLAPQIPKENIWGRTTPVKVVKNLEKGWLAKTLKKISPPVEGEEWERLRELAGGNLVEDVPVRRGRRKKDDGVGGMEGAFEWEDVMGRIKGGDGRGEKILSSRGLRRLYGVIWAQTPKMTYDASRKSWETEWGREGPMAKRGVDSVPKAVGREMELFEGVEELVEKMDKGGRGKKGKKPEKKLERMRTIE